MSSKGIKPWWENSYSSPNEKYEFLRAIGGASGPQKNNALLALLAGYVGGRILAKRRSDNK